MPSFWYTKSVKKIFENTIDLDTDTFKVGLTNATHVPAKTTDEFCDNGGADDLSDGEGITGYTGGFAGASRTALTSRVVSITGGSNDQVMIDAADIVWSGLSSTIAQATMMKEITNDAASPVIINLDFNDVNPAGNSFTLQFAATGLGYGQT